MPSSVFARRHTRWDIGPKPEFYPKLPVGVYILGQDDTGLFLDEAAPFEMPPKIYGSVDRQAERILETFHDRPYLTGVLLEGEKGSGKTLLAKRISLLGANLGLPTILVNAPFCGDPFHAFMLELKQPAILLFDEFEKVYSAEMQPHLLTFLDGVVPTKKLCILTVNDRYKLDTNMVNRPGRLFYTLSFQNLEEDFIREYVLERLENQKHADEVIKLATMFVSFNFDQIQALVEEMNRYDETPFEAMRWLNIQPGHENHRAFDVELLGPDDQPLKLYDEEGGWTGNPLDLRRRDMNFSFIKPSKRKGRDYEYEAATFKPQDLVRAEGGRLHFKNAKKFTLRLTPKPPPKFNPALGYNFKKNPAAIDDLDFE